MRRRNFVGFLLYIFLKRSRKQVGYHSSSSSNGCFPTRWKYFIREFSCSNCSAGIDWLFYFCRVHSFLMMIIPTGRRVLPHWNSRHWSRKQLQCFLIIPASHRSFLISFLIIPASPRVRHSRLQAHPTLITAHCYLQWKNSVLLLMNWRRGNKPGNLLSTGCMHRTTNPTLFSGIFFRSFDATLAIESRDARPSGSVASPFCTIVLYALIKFPCKQNAQAFLNLLSSRSSSVSCSSVWQISKIPRLFKVCKKVRC